LCSSEWEISKFDTETKKTTFIIKLYLKENITTTSLSPDSSNLMVGGESFIKGINPLPSTEPVTQYSHRPGFVSNIKYHRTGNYFLALTDGVIFNFITKVVKNSLEIKESEKEERFENAIYSPCGKKIVAATAKGKIVQYDLMEKN
jgi:hypothetical protein